MEKKLAILLTAIFLFIVLNGCSSSSSTEADVGDSIFPTDTTIDGTYEGTATMDKTVYACTLRLGDDGTFSMYLSDPDEEEDYNINYVGSFVYENENINFHVKKCTTTEDGGSETRTIDKSLDGSCVLDNNQLNVQLSEENVQYKLVLSRISN